VLGFKATNWLCPSTAHCSLGQCMLNRLWLHCTLCGTSPMLLAVCSCSSIGGGYRCVSCMLDRVRLNTADVAASAAFCCGRGLREACT
jgi:hypothetical protein